MNAILARLSEPSTWAGLSAIIMAGAQLATRQVDPVTGVSAILAGALAVLRREGR